MQTTTCPECGTELMKGAFPFCHGDASKHGTGYTAAHGDECDVWIEHGLCHDDGSPRHFTSKREIARVAKEKGLVQFVRHQTAPGTDKNQHTQNFAVGMPPGVDGRPTCMLTPEEQAARRAEWLATLPADTGERYQPTADEQRMAELIAAGTGYGGELTTKQIAAQTYKRLRG